MVTSVILVMSCFCIDNLFNVLIRYSSVPNFREGEGSNNAPGGKLPKFPKTSGVVFMSFSYSN